MDDLLPNIEKYNSCDRIWPIFVAGVLFSLFRVNFCLFLGWGIKNNTYICNEKRNEQYAYFILLFRSEILFLLK